MSWTQTGAASNLGRFKEIDGLRRKLATQPVIDQAKGVLVGLYGIHPDIAFDVLVDWSQHTNTKLHLIAAALVSAATEWSGSPGAGLDHFIADLIGPA